MNQCNCWVFDLQGGQDKEGNYDYRQCRRLAKKILKVRGMVYDFCTQHYKVVKKELKEEK